MSDGLNQFQLAKTKSILLIEGALVLFVLALLVLQYIGTSVGWIALPLAAWAGVLLLRPSMPDAKRFVLFLIGTALLITIVVEVVVVRGDIGRQNTIFKFYLQSCYVVSPRMARSPGYYPPLQMASGLSALLADCMILLIASAALLRERTAERYATAWIGVPHVRSTPHLRLSHDVLRSTPELVKITRHPAALRKAACHRRSERPEYPGVA